jgi:hypothetical protein
MKRLLIKFPLKFGIWFPIQYTTHHWDIGQDVHRLLNINTSKCVNGVEKTKKKLYQQTESSGGE